MEPSSKLLNSPTLKILCLLSGNLEENCRSYQEIHKTVSPSPALKQLPSKSPKSPPSSYNQIPKIPSQNSNDLLQVMSTDPSKFDPLSLAPSSSKHCRSWFAAVSQPKQHLGTAPTNPNFLIFKKLKVLLISFPSQMSSFIPHLESSPQPQM